MNNPPETKPRKASRAVEVKLKTTPRSTSFASVNNTKLEEITKAESVNEQVFHVVIEIGCISQEGLYHENEDRMCYGVDLNSEVDGYVGVFDGHGGDECAEFVKENLSRYLLNHFQAENDWNKGDERMKEMFHTIEEKFVEIANEEDDTSGSCATVVIVKGYEALIANIGDVKAIAVPDISEESYLILTGDHRADAEEEQERIERAGGSVVDGRVGNLQPSRSFGDIDVKEIVGDGVVIPTPEVSNVRMQKGGFMIVATDGLWDNVSDTNVVSVAKDAIINKHLDVEAVANELVKLAVNLDATDDVTVSVLYWDEI